MPVLRSEIYLIGHQKKQLSGSKLPSKLDCLRVLFYNLRTKKLNVAKSARIVIRECSNFWERARIPVISRSNAEQKLVTLYNKWKQFSRRKLRDSDSLKQKRESWKDSLDDLFDMAHVDALNIIKIEEDKQFLIQQRLKGRPGCMIGIDANLKKREENREKRQQAVELRRQQFLEAPSTSKGKYICKSIPILTKLHPYKNRKISSNRKFGCENRIYKVAVTIENRLRQPNLL